MTSLVFMLSEHHVIIVASHWHGIGMTSLCSRHVCIMCVMSSHLSDDVNAFACES